FQIQVIDGDRVWAQLQLVESAFPKGPLGSVAPAKRTPFLRDSRYVPGVRLSEEMDGVTRLHPDTVVGTDWLPGTVAGVYGTTDPEAIAIKEHMAAKVQVHPRFLPGALPLNHIPTKSRREGDEILITDDGSETLDLSRIKAYWANWFGMSSWPVADLYYGLIQRFVRRVVVADPVGFEAVRGRSLLYLGNHQTGIESLLFSILASGLAEVPTVTLAKIEHQQTWLGKLIKLCFSYPSVRDPRVIAFFDRSDKASLPGIIGELAAEMIHPGRSVMVHVEGTRSLTCRKPVQKMSGAFIDMALKVNAPIVPVRFVGGLPTAALEKRLEFPIGMGQQDVWFGRPIHPEELSRMTYGDRKTRVIAAINALGPTNAVEEPIAGDTAFADRVEAWRSSAGVSHEHATLLRILQESPAPSALTQVLLNAVESPPLQTTEDAVGTWLRELGRRLLGRRGG
ncbi:MAG: 1-acyl-sn-glycerol-3-phosphate acyltransferase, partial [Myxococcota bacterium]